MVIFLVQEQMEQKLRQIARGYGELKKKKMPMGSLRRREGEEIEMVRFELIYKLS